MNTLRVQFCGHCGIRTFIVDDDWTLFDNHVAAQHSGRRR